VPVESEISTEQLDVLVVGAGISGISAGWHLQDRCPGRSYAILEARGDLGGTWDLFRYPGIRSDSDMHTFGFRFRPWPEPKAIADGASIRRYLHDTAREFGIDRRIRYGHRAARAAWSWRDARWTVEVERTDGSTARIGCGFLLMCSGYYDYDRGHAPAFHGAARFRGRIVHPQHWPDDLDWTARRVVVIGSGATAVTLVPAMADRAAHVTMLQRSPSWVVSAPAEDPVERALRGRLPAWLLHGLVRWKNVLLTAVLFRLCRAFPGLAGRVLRALARRALPPGYDVATHFTPRYDPWLQRLCVVPDGDLFRAIGSGRASVVTGEIASFDETGLLLRSGEHLQADVVVTATGLELKFLGGLALAIDGAPLDPTRSLPYRGTMLSDVPNLAMVFGYTNASWTLRADLVCAYVCRLLNHMDRVGARWCVPRVRDPDIGTRPYVDLTSGYIRRASDRLPRQGDRAPWRAEQSYLREIRLLRFGRIPDPSLEFGGEAPPGGRASA
jgi:monooxygenase